MATGGTDVLKTRLMDTHQKLVTIRIKRYDPETETSSVATFAVPMSHDLTILDALNHIKNTGEGSLTYRWACRMGICGSCGAVVNGKPVLMCSTFCRDFKHPITVEPMRNFPVIKDLVVDIDDSMEKLRQALPYTTIMKNKAKLDHELLQTPKQHKKIKQSSQCIKCMLCYSACPIYGLDKDHFVGPAAGALAKRFNDDNHDQLKEKRMDSMTTKNGIWNCSFVGECSVVCPKKVDPALALQKLKVMGVLHIAKSALKLRKKKNT
jgi:fumarate reductase iron-sulfur subunit